MSLEDTSLHKRFTTEFAAMWLQPLWIIVFFQVASLGIGFTIVLTDI